MTSSKPLWSVNTIDHVGIVVLDADAAQRHFLETFGLIVTHDEEVHEAAARLVHLEPLSAGPTSLQLVQPLGPGRISDFLEHSGEGVHHICFGVEQIVSTLARIPSESGTRTFQGGKGRLACFLTEPSNGVLVELAEMQLSTEVHSRASTSIPPILEPRP